MKKTLITLLVVCSISFAFGQQKVDKDTLNYTDINGKKQGPWRKTDPAGVLQFEGFFKNDVPVGEFKKYHSNGKLKYLMYYNPKNQKDVKVTMYDVAGDIAAKGFYYDKLKDSTWQYFGQADKLLLEEHYKKGKLDGKATVYWQIGANLPAEIKHWKDSVKHGDWFWFYETGQMRMKAHYTNNKLDGAFIVYFIDGSIHVNGTYVNDLRDGTWSYFNDNGTRRGVIVYNMGKVVNEDEYERQQTKMIDEQYLKNVPTFKEPDLTKDLDSQPDDSATRPKDPNDPENFINDPESYIFKSQQPEQQQAPEEKNKKKNDKKQK